ncbi:MAG: hypothetical protein HQ551_11320 [Desulfobacteraceae bacterium]|nr:hypothetical protein [Desulfobacteraceae bacterium]
MKIEELISGKNDNEVIEIEGVSIPISALKNLIKDGYVNLKAYKEEKTFSLWGKTCTACLTEQELREKA